ncbi:GNAT family N-acetyltransferase [Staphylococcus lutrae]|uniref:GNAT family N-acetyltransferase n=1 Tax=Staphylococcus lutrae TaxID=155085 RepID=A0AAC9RUR2_9STAP|nr:GNAT family N-acetyltransferase [Staphylococcus lutrae]ARJ51335.1 GNAT family N-acetyltransferase [Staphylococcus lutrae]PNZ35845.1 N-acetyltransferase [Staphylococcus lutrae]
MIKVLTHEDSNQFKQLISTAHEEKTSPYFDKVYALPTHTLENSDQLLHPDSQNQVVILGAFHHDALIGFIQLNFNLEITKRHKALLKSLYVAPPYRHEDIAQQLVETLISFARDKGIEHIVLSVASNNIAAKNFFNQLGFEFLAIEAHARKIDDRYIEDHWFIYYT